MDWDGEVAGVQFDRFGGLWLNGLELLRTTTPEPDLTGIKWHVEKDFTEYSDIFTRSGSGAVTIPNIVNSEYTGALKINVTFTFFMAENEYDSPELTAPHIFVLGDYVDGGKSPWDKMAIKGDLNQSHAVSIPPSISLSHGGNPDGLHGALRSNTGSSASSSVDTVLLDVIASGHGCEEFWYTNVPDDFKPGTI